MAKKTSPVLSRIPSPVGLLELTEEGTQSFTAFDSVIAPSQKTT